MSLEFRPTTLTDARAFCGWRYDGVLAWYNLSPRALPLFMNRTYRYHTVRTPAGRLVGFCCFGADARVDGLPYLDAALDVGLGMSPALVGRGLGRAFVGAVIQFAEAHCGTADRLRLTVAGFNRRAIAVYHGHGFTDCAAGEVEHRGVRITYQVMTRPVGMPIAQPEPLRGVG